MSRRCAHLVIAIVTLLVAGGVVAVTVPRYFRPQGKTFHDDTELYEALHGRRQALVRGLLGEPDSVGPPIPQLAQEKGCWVYERAYLEGDKPTRLILTWGTDERVRRILVWREGVREVKSPDDTGGERQALLG